MIKAYKFPNRLPDVTFAMIIMASMDLLGSAGYDRLKLIGRQHNDLICKFDIGYYRYSQPILNGFDRAGFDFDRNASLVKRLLSQVLATFQE